MKTLLIFLFLMPAMVQAACNTALVDELLAAERAGQAAPRLTQTQPDLQLPRAYRVQTQYALALAAGEQLAGFKAGLTSVAAQQAFAADEPIAGALLRSGRWEFDDAVPLAGLGTSMLEAEIGFVVGKMISAPLADVAALQAHLRAALPVIEMPDLAFAGGKPNVLDIVAANAAAARFITGRPMPLTALHAGSPNIVLLRDGEALLRVTAGDVYGDALWLVNHALAQGYTLHPGMLLLTGAQGPMLPAVAGSYLASFGQLGTMRFELLAAP